MHIKNIIFDLGNVIIDIDPDETSRRLRKYFDLEYDFFKNKMSQTFLDYEVGLLTEKEFSSALAQHAPAEISAEEVLEHWNSMLLDIPESRLKMLEELSPNYRLYILSNTNYTHMKWVRHFLEHNFGRSNFEQWGVIKAYLSHELGARKPDRESYEKVLEMEKMNPQETLFIDDHPDNIQAAKVLGIQSVWHAPGKEITSEIEDYLLQF